MKNVRWPVSRVLYPGAKAPVDDHSSGTPVTKRLVQPTRMTVRKQTRGAKPLPSLFGFAPGGVYHARPVTSAAVRSYRTLSPLPLPKQRRFPFCGTFPGVTPAGRYPAPRFRGARTFLCPSQEEQRPSGHLTPQEYASGRRCQETKAAYKAGAPRRSTSTITIRSVSTPNPPASANRFA